MPVPPHRLLSPALAGVLACVLALAGAGLAPAPAFAARGERWSLSGTDPVAATIAISRFAFPDGADQAVLARADQFPDALASGLLQDSGPLLLTGTTELHADTAAELRRLGVDDVVVLGGTAAISEAVVAALTEAGYGVTRLSGTSRVDTAVAIASSRPVSRTVILARAFGAGEDPSQGFADALAAGAWSAAAGYPVLLSETERLSGSTAAYLKAAAVRTVMVVGGTAALGAQVERGLLALGVGVRRVAGSERAATAAAIAAARGFDTAADVRDVVLAPGRGDDAWAAGFAAAALAADGDVAVLLAEADALPAATRRFLAAGGAGLVCTPLLPAGRCEQAADELDLDPPVVGAFAEPGRVDLVVEPAGAREYTVPVTGGGPVTLALADAAASAASPGGWVLDEDGDGLADTTATTALVRAVAGSEVDPAVSVGGVRPSAGKATFTVRAPDGGAVRPFAYVDADGDGGLDVAGDGTPLEPAAVGGALIAAPASLAAGSHADQVLTQAWPALGLASTATAALRWDADDTFAYNSGLSSPVTLNRAQFESMVSAGDTLAVNLAGSSRFTIVRDVPAAPAGVSAVPADTDGDALPDVLRVRWARPVNTDLAGTGTYVVQLSKRGADGAWGGWTAAGAGSSPSALTDDLEPGEGLHRVRLVARNASNDSSRPSRPVVAALSRGAASVPPVSVSAVFTAGSGQASGNTILDAGDRFAVTFSAPVQVAAGAWLDLRDKDGTFVRLTRDSNAAFTPSADGKVLTVAVTGPPAEHPGLSGDRDLNVGELVVAEAVSGITNGAGLWNLPASGADASGEQRTRALVGANSALPAAVPATSLSADPTLDRITIAAAASGIANGDPFTVFNRHGVGLATGTYNATNGTTVTSTAFAEGEKLYVVYTDLDGARLPSRSASLLVGSPRPVLLRAEGANDTITLVWAEPVTLHGTAALVEVYDKEDRLLVARTQSVQQAGSDRILVDLDTDLAMGGQYTVHVGAGLVRDAGLDSNDAAAPALTTGAAAPTLAVIAGPASGATVNTATPTWSGTAADTAGVVTAVQRQVDGGGWVSTGVTAAVPDDSLSWSLALTLAEGTHTVEVRAVDDNGAFSAVVSRTVTVNAAAPAMTGAVAAIGAKTVVVTFSEAVSCPNAGAASWSFDDTSGANNDAVGSAVDQAGLPTNQCRITFGAAAANFAADTAGTLTYGAPGAGAQVTDPQATPMAANSNVAVSAA